MQRIRKPSSAVWNYFVVHSQVDRKAVCNACKKICSYKSTITNLKLHLKQKHKVEYAELCSPEAQQKFEDDKNSSSEEQKIYIQNNDNDDSLATVAGFVSDSESEQDKGNDNPFSEVVYLEDEFNKNNKISGNRQFKKIHRKRKHSKNEESLKKSKTENVKNNIRNDSITETKIDETANVNDELSIFSRYVTCLLRQLPKDVSSRLQMTIVHDIMVEKVKVEQSMPFIVINNVRNETENNCINDNVNNTNRNLSFEKTLNLDFSG